MQKERCTVVVSSCDAYSDLWDPFFTILYKNWDVPYPTVLNTETKTYAFGGREIPTLQLYKAGENPVWGERFRKTLERVKTKYVFNILEDFFLTSPVDGAHIEQVMDWMDADDSIACFSFYPVLDENNVKSDLYPGYEQRPQVGPYRFNLQASVWRRDFLLQHVLDTDSAWGWETEGNERSYTVTDKLFTLCPDAAQPVPYDPYQHSVYSGRWLEGMPQLFARYGLDVDFSERGFFDEKHRALHPQVGVNYKTAPVLYIDAGGGFSEETRIPWQGEPLGAGPFRCVFRDVDRISRGSFVRIDPSESPYCMLEDVEVTVTFRGGKTWQAAGTQLGTNGVRVFDKIAMMNSDPQLWAAVPVHKPIARVEIRGVAHARIPEDVVDRALEKAPDNAAFHRACLLNKVLRRIKK